MTHPDVLEELKACQTQSIFVKAAPAVVAQGEKLARQGNREDAVATFRKALKWNPKLNLDPEAKAKPLADASDLVETGENLVQEGKIEDAVAQFQRALKLDPDLDFEINTKVNSALVRKGESLVKEGKIKEAISAYTQAQKFAPTVEISADSWRSLCQYGSPRGYAADVMFACEKAVALAPDDGGIRGRRGVARALTGNTKGAIEDFQAFIATIQDQKRKAQRQRWVNALRAGKNPFTPEDIKSLLNQ